MNRLRTGSIPVAAALLGVTALLCGCGAAGAPRSGTAGGLTGAAEGRTGAAGGQTGEVAADEPTAPLVELISDDGLPGEEYAELSPDGAWCWFGEPRAVTVQGEGSRTFAGYVTSAGDIEVARYDHRTRELERVVVKEELQNDDHASPALLVRPDGRLMVFYSGHRGRWMVYRISAEAEDIGEWGKPHAASGHTSEAWGYTYPSPLILSEEEDRRYLFWRGTEFRPMMSISETGLEWSEAVPVISGGGETPYFKVASDGRSSIHFVFSEDHPRHVPANSIRYLRYENGVFTRADGSLVGSVEDLPLELADCDLVYDAGDGGARAWPWDLAIAPSGAPVIAYTAFPEETDHRYRYAAWDGTEWRDSEIVGAGSWFPTVGRGRRHFEPYYSGGVALDHSDPSVVYLSRPVEGVFEIERWRTEDLGASWSSEPVTIGSESNNVRPVVPYGRADGGPQLVWMNGPYDSYSDYSTSLRMK